MEVAIAEMVEQLDQLRETSSKETEFYDKVFLADLKRIIKNTD
jgi:hypothetical protein